MLKLRDLQLEDKSIVEKYFYRDNLFSCDYSFTALYMWSRHHKVKLCEENGFLFIYSEDYGMEYFLAPMSIDDKPIKPAIDALIEYTKARENELLLVAVLPYIKEKIELEMPDCFTFSEARENADYIYTKDSLATLKGKKLHGKRNHINRFIEEYAGRWSFETLTDDNIHDFFAFQLKWCNLNDEFIGELQGAASALKHYKYLGLRGGLLRIDNEVIAVTFGSKMLNSMIVHIEKADPEIQGAYQMINQQFAINCCDDVEYINREEDMGLPGLRKAKLSYYPEFLGINYEGRYND